MIYVGIDPGQSGGIAWLGPGNVVGASKMPETERDLLELLGNVVRDSSAVVVLEQVHAMPKQGVSSTFKFGQHYGMLRGFLIALQVPFVEVAPTKWQKALECGRPRRKQGAPKPELTQQEMSARKREHKNDTKARAQQLYPRLKKITHATADALLLATYCSRQDWTGVASDREPSASEAIERIGAMAREQLAKQEPEPGLWDV